jgi:mRNA interferase MazF
VICSLWNVVVVPFPFSERPGTKRRPALVISKKTFNDNGHTVLAMITTKAHEAWPGDVEIKEAAEAGLHQNCIIRLKLFTLDNRLILKQIGHLSESDRKRAETNLRRYLI